VTRRDPTFEEVEMGSPAEVIGEPEHDELGPVECLIVEFPSRRVPGTAFHQLLDLVERDLVRVLDLEFVHRDPNGAVSLVDADTVLTEGGGELPAFVGATSGLLDADDVARVGEMIAPGSLAGVLIYESVWVAAMAAQARATGCRVISMGPVEVEDLVDALGA
jgi:hypothetical protein